jgi:hypothetical protein
MTPIRIQRKRSKGWKMPENTVCVSRGTKWGNPFRVMGKNTDLFCDASHRRKILDPWVIYDFDEEEPATVKRAVELFRRWLTQDLNAAGIVRPCLFTEEDIRRELRGKNLVCWCRLDQPCHADVLLEIANQVDEKPNSRGSGHADCVVKADRVGSAG